MPNPAGVGTSSSRFSAANPSASFSAASASASPGFAKPITRDASAYRTSAASSPKRVIAGNSIAFESPCGTWKCAPIGRDIPCTKATDALVNAIPACIAPSIIASRAAALPGSAYAVRRFAPINRIAATACVSEYGLARRDTYASNACVKLSTPVSAVIRFGTLNVSS